MVRILLPYRYDDDENVDKLKALTAQLRLNGFNAIAVSYMESKTKPKPDSWLQKAFDDADYVFLCLPKSGGNYLYEQIPEEEFYEVKSSSDPSNGSFRRLRRHKYYSLVIDENDPATAYFQLNSPMVPLFDEGFYINMCRFMAFRAEADIRDWDASLKLEIPSDEVKTFYQSVDVTWKPKLELSPYLEEIEVNKYFCIESVSLTQIDHSREVYFLGENGDGKTLLLQALVLALKDWPIQTNTDKAIGGEVFNAIDKNKEFEFSMVDSNDVEYEQGLIDWAFPVYAYGVYRRSHRTAERDPYGFLTIFDADLSLQDPDEWLQNLDYRVLKGEALISLDTAQEMLRDIMGTDFSFKVSPDGVRYFERGSELSLNQLSEGYRSVMTWVLDLLSHLVKSQPEVTKLADYVGIVMVDEIGLHLHPKWEQSIVRKLRQWFPKIQFFFTTHSPVTIMGASEDAIFYKITKVDGKTTVSEPYAAKNMRHLMANGVITSPLFDLEDARMAAFDEDHDDLDTSDDYLHGLIRRKVAQKVAEKRAAGKAHLSFEDIDKLVDDAIDEEDL